MGGTAETESSGAAEPGEGLATWGWLALVGLVAVVLIALAVGDRVVQTGIIPRQDAIEHVADPTLSVVSDLQLTLARRMSAIRGYLLTEESVFQSRYATLRAEEQEHLVRLDSLSSGLGPAVRTRVDSLRAAIDAWDRWVARTGVMTPADPVIPPLATAVLDQQFYDAALDASLSLESAVRTSVERLRAEIADRSRLADRLSLALVLLALAAAAGVGALGYRLLRLNEGLRQRQGALEQVTQSRSRLLRGFSHDLKNPLGAADGHAALLASGIPGPLTEAQVNSVHRIRATLRSAFELIHELVELGRVESGQMQIRPRRVDPASLVRRVVEDYRPQATAAGLHLAARIAGELPTIETDPQRVEQILGNLLSNAVKYTDEGGVRVGVHAVMGGAGSPSILIRVTDSGPGIPPEKMELLFQEFSRLQVTSTPGAGLGLAISARIAEALGGEIRAESEPGRGSTFTLVLPERTPQGSASAASRPGMETAVEPPPTPAAPEAR